MYKLIQLFVTFLIFSITHTSQALENRIVPSALPVLQIESKPYPGGIYFSCAPDRIKKIKTDMEKYLASQNIQRALYNEIFNENNGIINFSLNTPNQDYSTLKLKDDPAYTIRDEIVVLPGKHGKKIQVETVSQKEILLAMMQHGRATDFDGNNCSVDALKEHVGLRQNIVAWAENLNWDWPDGDYAKWNTRYWRKGTPLPGVKITKAFSDAFTHQNDYSIGCYTATKLVYVQGILDFYSRIHTNRKLEKLIEARLEQDHDPLTHIEPGKMWSFETDFDLHDMTQPGKLLQIQSTVAPKNFIPGDWIYILNTDPVSSRKTGYEGSNAIYLGRNKFDDYYNDNDHSYTYQQKLDEVFQWRNGVFSRSRDHDKIKPLTQNDFERLSESPKKGGLIMDIRAFPYMFAGGDLPSLATKSMH